MVGKIMKISRFRMATDGDGISTLVAMYGCPLHCKYCINSFCNKADTVTAEFTPQELVDVISIDDSYFKMTGGGIVFGGGEPLLQAEYIEAVCKLIDMCWDIRIETSLNEEWKNVEVLLPYVAQWIIDIKDVNSKIYQCYTGRDNRQVLENLDRLIKCIDKNNLVVRVPHITEYNSEDDVKKTIDYLNVLGVKLEVFEYIV